MVVSKRSFEDISRERLGVFCFCVREVLRFA
jgi:hypothetical protein